MNRRKHRKASVVKAYIDGLHDYMLYDSDKRMLNLRWDSLDKAEYISTSYLNDDTECLIRMANASYIDKHRQGWIKLYNQDITYKHGSILFPLHGALYAHEGNAIVGVLQEFPCIDDSLVYQLEIEENA